ncbi:MAG: hypothetical protein HY735_13055 [Verrucomicrobia bacterium]|nr:hypothetical protein [Verrucomicrobiota bacterium]
MFAACCSLDIPTSVVATGHIASREGDLRFVRNLAAKLHAAVKDENVTRFIYPDHKADDSLANLAPEEFEEIEPVIRGAHHDLATVAVRNIVELVKNVFSEQSIIRGSLGVGFFDFPLTMPRVINAAHSVAFSLAGDGANRFFRCLHRALLDGNSSLAGTLLNEFLDFHFRKSCYPHQFGERLDQLLASIPPATLRLRIEFPLVSEEGCDRFKPFITEAEKDDFELLKKAVSKDRGTAISSASIYNRDTTKAAQPHSQADESARITLDFLLAELDEPSLARKIDLPLDNARASYRMGSTIVTGNGAFLEIVTAFLLHVLSHTNALRRPVQPEAARAQALDLLQRTFAKTGGYAEALAIATSGTQGGLRAVLDSATEQLKHEKRQAYALYLLDKAIDPTDWPCRVAFMRAFFNRFRNSLPLEFQQASPERFANRYREVVAGFIQNSLPVKRLVHAR